MSIFIQSYVNSNLHVSTLVYNVRLLGIDTCPSLNDIMQGVEPIWLSAFSAIVGVSLKCVL